MSEPDREQLRRDCSAALAAVQQDRGVERLAPLATALQELGPEYRAHGVLMETALAARKDVTVIWHLIQVLQKLEKET